MSSSRDLPGRLEGIKGVLFDKDGTLLDYEKSWASVNLRAAQIAARGNSGLSARLLMAGGADPLSGRVEAGGVLSMGTAAEIATAWVAAGAPFTVNALTCTLDDLFRSAVEQVVPVTDLEPLFNRLHVRGLKLGIASSDSEEAVFATAARFGIDRLVDFMAGYDSGFGAKPSPGIVTAFCDRTELTAPEVAVVGDSINDMLMGRAANAGIIIGVLSGTGAHVDLRAYADVCVDSIQEVARVLFD
jgi:phosphoglycolate phosphatase